MSPILKFESTQFDAPIFLYIESIERGEDQKGQSLFVYDGSKEWRMFEPIVELLNEEGYIRFENYFRRNKDRG